MSDLPTYSDAAILIALAWGGDPLAVLGAVDHLDAGYPNYSDWTRACALLGKLGLIATGEPFPFPTETGNEIVNHYCPPGMPPRTGAMKVREALMALPSVAAPVPPPARGVIDDAIGKLERRREIWFESRFPPQSPRWSDAWIFVSLFLGKGDPVATLQASDHLNHAYPSAEEWTHACAVLGRRELIVPAQPLPYLAPLGEAILNRHRTAISSRSTLTAVLADLSELPAVAESVMPPDPEVIAKANGTIRKQNDRWSEEWSTDTTPILRDAWILASLHLGRAVDWRTISIGDEDGPAQPRDADWRHAVVVLTKRGLIVRHLLSLRTTEIGVSLVESCSPAEPSAFRFVLCVLEAIKRAPADGPVQTPPSWVFRRTERALGWH